MCDIHQGPWLIGTLELWEDRRVRPVRVMLRLLTSQLQDNIFMPLLRGIETEEDGTVSHENA